MLRCRLTLILLVIACAWPATAHAQLGVGMRLAWVKPNTDVQPPPDSQRFTGAQLRARLSPRTGIELSYDWFTEENDTKTIRTKERPFQGTLLVNLMGGSFAPQLLGGIGWYKTTVETLDGSDKVLESSSDTKLGYHFGFGAEIRAGSHFGLHGDYRYRYIHTDEEVDSGVPVIGGIFEKLGLSRSGSMWTGGVTVYF